MYVCRCMYVCMHACMYLGFLPPTRTGKQAERKNRDWKRCKENARERERERERELSGAASCSSPSCPCWPWPSQETPPAPHPSVLRVAAGKATRSRMNTAQKYTKKRARACKQHNDNKQRHHNTLHKQKVNELPHHRMRATRPSVTEQQREKERERERERERKRERERERERESEGEGARTNPA